ncbi:hypothetical protein F2Q69_00036660 [Brassica cretica]|uniref:Uncharacterized protein n=1 Tax=Brassica cretica TaxID=69181 RepID=A0A8S9SR44_BRACR|nr:hypothetical protein F2Q69_00036660 [Brassica cretica]
MHGLMLYRRFGRARSLHSDRAERRYVATELVCGSSVMTELGSSVFRLSYSDLSVTGLVKFGRIVSHEAYRDSFVLGYLVGVTQGKLGQNKREGQVNLSEDFTGCL